MTDKTIVFVHGMYMTPLCWEGWVDRFQSKGYACLAPAWPGREAPVAALRLTHPDPKLGALTLRSVIAGITSVIQALPVKPIVIGHSMGGLVTQILAARGLAAAAIAIDSAPPQGVFSAEWSFIKANLPHINPFARQDVPIEMTFERFQYAFVNGMSLAEQRAAFERYVVPESRRVPAESLTGAAHVDFKRPGPPLLLVAGESDHIIPASLTRANYRRYKRADSRTDLLSFAGRNHFLLGQPGWEEVADAIVGWLGSLPPSSSEIRV